MVSFCSPEQQAHPDLGFDIDDCMPSDDDNDDLNNLLHNLVDVEGKSDGEGSGEMPNLTEDMYMDVDAVSSPDSDAPETPVGAEPAEIPECEAEV
jgi:hypothetical protein